MSISQAISDYGFPIVATIGLLYMIYFIWGFIRLQQKLDTVIELRDNQERKNAKTKTK